MRLSEGRGCLQTMPSVSILEHAKRGQLRIVVRLWRERFIKDFVPKLPKFPTLPNRVEQM